VDLTTVDTPKNETYSATVDFTTVDTHKYGTISILGDALKHATVDTAKYNPNTVGILYTIEILYTVEILYSSGYSSLKRS